MKLYRPTLQKQPKTAKGYVACMTDQPHPADNEWNGRESREWVKFTDHAADLARADARIAELERDAARYRWLRRRVRLAREEMMSGAIKECLTVRMAWSSLERKDDPVDGYLSQDRFNYECDALDAAIDAARAGNGGEG